MLALGPRELGHEADGGDGGRRVRGSHERERRAQREARQPREQRRAQGGAQPVADGGGCELPLVRLAPLRRRQRQV